MTQTISNTSDVTRLLARVSTRLLPFLLILYVISYLDRINLSFAALQMQGDLRLTDENFGFGSGIFFFGYCAFGIPSNLAIERFGPRRWISSIMVAWGLVTLAMCLVGDQNSFYALRLLLGIAEAGFFPGMLLYLTRWFPPAQYGLAVARFMIAIPLAGVVGSLIAAPTLSLAGFLGLAGWKWLFLLTGMPAIIFGVLTFFLLADRPSEAKWLSREEGLTIEKLTACKNYDNVPGADPPAPVAEADSSILAAFSSVRVWRFALLYFSMAVCMYGFQLWLPQIIKSFGHLSDSQSALLSAIPAVFQGLGMYFVAGSSDRRNERRLHVVASAVITITGLLAACFFDASWVRLLGVSLAAFGIWGSVGPFWALTRSCLKTSAQPAGIAFINSVGGLGGFFGPYFVGLVKTLVPNLNGANSSFAGALVLLSAAALLTIILALTSPRPQS